MEGDVSDENVDKIFIGMIVIGLVMICVASIVKLVLWVIIWG
jgi:hypothetical protein